MMNRKPRLTPTKVVKSCGISIWGVQFGQMSKSYIVLIMRMIYQNLQGLEVFTPSSASYTGWSPKLTSPYNKTSLVEANTFAADISRYFGWRMWLEPTSTVSSRPWVIETQHVYKCAWLCVNEYVYQPDHPARNSGIFHRFAVWIRFVRIEFSWVCIRV